MIFVGLEVETVEVEALGISPVVALHHSVRVHHRDYLEDEEPPQQVGL